MTTRTYPIRGYAPGGYMCLCGDCGEKFEGDKRAFQCEPCALWAEVNSTKKYFQEMAVSHIEAQKRSCARHGYEPGQLQYAWRMGKEFDTKTLEDAICDALAMGGIAAHPGDGVSCAAQIVTGYAEHQTKTLKEAVVKLTLENNALIEKVEELESQIDNHIYDTRERADRD